VETDVQNDLDVGKVIDIFLIEQFIVLHYFVLLFTGRSAKSATDYIRLIWIVADQPTPTGRLHI